MATRTMYRIMLNNVLLPEIYFDYSDASAAYDRLQESTVAPILSIVPWNPDD
jgi:hypothetical protein